MSEKQETISDIIAEMRLGATGDMPFAYRIGRPDRIVEYKTKDGKKYVQRRAVIESVTIDELADRLEAAWKQDEEHAIVGNSARLREALVSVKKSIDGMGAASLDGDPEIMLMSLTQVCARLSARIDAALDATEQKGDAK